VDGELILRSESHVIGNENVEVVFSCISRWKVDRLSSNQHQNDPWLILHISSNTFYQHKCVMWYLSFMV